MKNTQDKPGHAPENRYARIAGMLGTAVFPQTIAVEAEGVAPESFTAPGLTKRELYAALALASLAHAVVSSRPAAGGTLRTEWTHRVAADAAALTRWLEEELDAAGPVEGSGEVSACCWEEPGRNLGELDAAALSRILEVGLAGGSGATDRCHDDADGDAHAKPAAR